MKSESIAELAAALAKAQGEIHGATKDSKNPFFQSSYADLGSVWEACRAPLSQNGLAITQAVDAEQPGNPILRTTLMHASGQWIDSTYPLSPADNKPQSVGSAISYARRYALAAMVGVYQTDDDGNDAQGRSENHPEAKILPPPQKHNLAPPIASTGQPTAQIKPPIQIKSQKTDSPGDAVRLKVLEAARKANWLPSSVTEFITACYGVSLVRDLTPEQTTYLLKVMSEKTHTEAMDNLRPGHDTSFDFGANAPERVK